MAIASWLANLPLAKEGGAGEAHPRQAESRAVRRFFGLHGNSVVLRH